MKFCSLAARGLWAFMRVEMKHSDRPGYLRLNGKPMSLPQLAQAAGCESTDEARRLTEQLDEAGLCKRSDAEGFYSPRIIAFDTFRRQCATAGKRGGGNPILQVSTYKGTPTFKGGSKGRSKGCSKGSFEGPPPPEVSPPLNPSLPTPTPENPNAAHSAGDVSANGSGKAEKPAKTRKPKLLPVFAPGVWDRAREGWGRAFQHVHGSNFHWNSRQAKGLSEVLQALDGDIGRFETVAKAWLKEPEVGPAKGHPLWQLATDLNYIESKIAKGTVGHGVAKPTAAERGEFPEERIELPTKRRSTNGAVA